MLIFDVYNNIMMFCCIICCNLIIFFIVFGKKIIIKSDCYDKEIGFMYVLIYFNLLCIYVNLILNEFKR